MMWLDLKTIKNYLRIETSNTLEDTNLTLFGESAETTILNYCDRTVDELKAMNLVDQTKIPADIILASLMLVEVSYQYNSSVSEHQLYMVPYAFEAKVKPYMRLERRKGGDS